jgi:hypothetical protein
LIHTQISTSLALKLETSLRLEVPWHTGFPLRGLEPASSTWATDKITWWNPTFLGAWSRSKIQDLPRSKAPELESFESFSFRPISCLTKSCGHWGPIKILFGWNTGTKKLHYLGLQQWLTRTERFSHAILGGKSMGVSRKLSLEPMGNRGQVTGYWSSWLEANAWPSWWHPLYFWVLSPFGQTKTPKMYCQAQPTSRVFETAPKFKLEATPFLSLQLSSSKFT